MNGPRTIFGLLSAAAMMAMPACASGGLDAPAMAGQYMAIVTPANHQLDVEHDALIGPHRDSPVAAATDLREISATERRFDRQLLALTLSDAVRATARVLVTENEARAALTLAAAGSSTIVELRAYEARIADADAAVEVQVRAIRGQLGLPPPDTG